MSFSKNPFLSSSKEEELDTFEARVQWAIKTRKIYVFKDNDEVGARVNTIDEDYDEEDIRDAQKMFEKRYKLKLQEREKEAEKTMANDLEQLFRKHPHLRDQIQLPKEKDVPAREFGKPTSTSTARPMMMSFSKRRAGAISDRSEDEEETVAPPSKRFKKDEVPISSKGGALYPISCSNCVKGGYECREQIPPKKACYQCNRMRAGCSFLGNPKYRRGANRVGAVKKTGVDVESEEIESEAEIVGSRRSEVAYAIREQTTRITTELTNIGSTLKKIEEQHRSRKEQSDVALCDLKNLMKMISGMINPVETTKKTAVMTSSSASGPNTKGGSTKPINVADRQHKAF